MTRNQKAIHTIAALVIAALAMGCGRSESPPSAWEAREAAQKQAVANAMARLQRKHGVSVRFTDDDWVAWEKEFEGQRPYTLDVQKALRVGTGDPIILQVALVDVSRGEDGLGGLFYLGDFPSVGMHLRMERTMAESLLSARAENPVTWVVVCTLDALKASLNTTEEEAIYFWLDMGGWIADGKLLEVECISPSVGAGT